MSTKDNHRNTSRLLVIGIDGGTWDIFRPLINKGVMPNLRTLVNDGADGILKSTIPPLTAPAWSSFLTGKNPAKHSIFHFSKKISEGDKSKVTPVNSRSIQGRLFPQILSDADKVIGLINIPMTYPPFPINGFMVSGMLTPEGAENFTYPVELKNELTDYQIDLPQIRKWVKKDLISPGKSKNAKSILADCLQMHARRTANVTYLACEYKWDILCVVFMANDRLCHHLWDAVAAKGDNILHPLAQEVITYYEQLDNTIGNLMNIAGRQASIIVLSDHGFGPSPKNSVNLTNWLIERKLLKLKIGGVSRSNKILQLKAKTRAILRNILPAFLQRQIMIALGTREEQYNNIIDYDNTIAIFSQIYRDFGGIVINRSCVPDDKYEILREQIITELKELSDPNTKNHLIKEAYRREKIYHGPHLSAAPDIVIQASDGYMFNLDPYATKLVTQTPQEGIDEFGKHQLDGIFVMHSPFVKQGAELHNIKIEDVAPTILYLMQTPIPEDMDGRVIQECFQDDFLKKNAIQYAAASEAVEMPSDETIYSQKDEAQVMKRLKDLGYL